MEQMVKYSFGVYLPEPIQKTRQIITCTFLLKLNNVWINDVLIVIELLLTAESSMSRCPVLWSIHLLSLLTYVV